jgi:hypothetical protein
VARALVACALGVIAAITVGGGTSTSARPLRQPGPLVVVGMPTLQWSQVTATHMPHLWGLATKGAVAAQATMVLDGRSCSVSSWLTLSAGTPTGSGRSPVIAGAPGAKGCARALAPKPSGDGSASYAGWPMLVETADTRGAPVRVGLLASSLEAAGQCVMAVGPDAAIGAANRSGVIARYAPTLSAAHLGRCPVTLIALGAPDDAALGQLLTRLPENATVVVTGIADEAGPVTLHPLVVAGPRVPHGLLTSSSTRQPGFVQTSDLTALVLSRLGSGAPHLSDGRAPVVLPSTSVTGPIEQVRGLTRALDVEHAFVGPFFALFLGGCLLAVGAILLGWWLLQGRLRTRGAPAALRAFVALVAAMGAATPVSAFLVGRWSWWQADSPRVALALGVLGTALLLALIALLGPWRRSPLGPTSVLAAVTVVVIGADVVNGSRLQFVSLLGLQPVFGGRYYGQGNVGFALYATAALLLATLLAGPLIAAGRRRTAAAAVSVLGVVAVLVDGYPSWGADGGGPLAMIPAFGYLALSAGGARLTGRRWALIAATAVVVVAGFATADYARPPADRTHIGMFVDQFLTTRRLDGLQRIWSENWKMLTGSWIDLTVVPLLLVIVLVLARPQLLTRLLSPVRARMPLLGNGLVAIAACWLVGFAVNDSGTAIPPTGLLLLAPLVLLLAVSRVRSRPPGSATPPEAAPESGGEPAPGPLTGTTVPSGTAATVAEA